MSEFIAVEALSALSPQALGLLDVNAAQALDAGALPVSASPGNATAGAFGQLVSDGLAGLNGQLIGDQVALQKLAAGEASNLHQIMIGLEETRMSFQLMLQVRSRLLEAYQDIMKMPI